MVRTKTHGSPPNTQNAAPGGTAVSYTFSLGARRGKSKKIPLPLEGGGLGWG